MGVQTLTQGRARRHATQTQGAHEEGVVTKVLFWLEVILAQTQQSQVALEDGTVGNARADRKSWIDRGIDIDALEILVDQSQPGVGAEAVGQFFDNKVGHLGFIFRVNSSLRISA